MRTRRGVVAICESDPGLAGLIAHFLSVSFDVLQLDQTSFFEVGVFPPYSLSESQHVLGVGEAPRFAVLDVTSPAVAYVTCHGFNSSSIERKAKEEAAPVFSLGELRGNEDWDEVEVADACVELARRIFVSLSPVSSGGISG